MAWDGWVSLPDLCRGYGRRHALRELLPLPAMLKLIMEWIAEYINSRRFVYCKSLHPQALGEIFRVDAKAEGNEVVLAWCVGEGLN